MHTPLRSPPNPRFRQPDETVALRSYAFERLSPIAAVLDDTGTIVDVNEAWRLFAQLNGGERRGVGPGTDYLGVCDRATANGSDEGAQVAIGLRAILSGTRDRFDVEYSCHSPTEDRWFRMSAAAAPVADGAGLVLFHLDITERKLLEPLVDDGTAHHRLEGPDRRRAVGVLDAELRVAGRSGRELTILSIVLDGFAGIIAEYGHTVGGRLLSQVDSRVRRATRETDRLHRVGVDELIVICPALELHDAPAMAFRLRESLARPYQVDALELVLGVSAGVATSDLASTVDSLLTTADAGVVADRTRPRPPDMTVPRAARGRERMAPLPNRPREREAEPDRPTGDLAEAQAARAMTEAMVAHSGDLVMMFQGDGTIEWASPATRALFGIGPEDVIGRNGLSIIHPDDQERVFSDFLSIPNLGDHVHTEFRVILPDGTVRWLDETATNLLDEPDVGLIVGNLRDVTDRHEAEEAAQFRATLLAAAGQAIIATDLDGIVTYWNRAAERTYGWSADEAIGAIVGLLLPAGDDLEATAADVNLRWQVGEPWTGEYRVRIKDGTTIPVLSTITGVMDGTGARIATIGVSTDITERHAAEEALAVLATHDSLTGLPNRSGLDARLLVHLDSADRAGGHLALAVVDLDRFKSLNDTLGRRAGDGTLRAVAERLRAGLRPTDEIFRRDGDEFIVLRPGAASDDDATKLGIDAARALDGPMRAGDQMVEVTASVGVARLTDTDTAESLLRDAGAAMNQAKADGRDRVVAFDAQGRERAQRRLSLETALHHALDLDQLYLTFQPVLEVASLRIAGFEALLRWDHPDLGAVGPDEFIPIAEATGLILPIGDWVLQRSLEQLAAWVALPDLDDDLWIAVNLSTRQLGQPSLAARVAETIERVGVRPDSVHLEITESIFVDHVTNAVETIVALRAAGAQISMDDFGTGYSSLSYLNRLPMSTLKIDRSFMQGLGGEGNDESIVRAIIALADSLGLDVIAEGVETDEQHRIIEGLGCRFGQGYLWSRPLRADDALAWLRGHASAG